MTIWLLALILLASLAGIGYRQGAIRVAFSLIGIIFAALLAAPLGRVIRPVIATVGIKNPVLLWVLGPLLIFIIILVAFKIGALAAHRKVDVFYKYKAGDLRLALWERLNQRLGLCLGIVNGTVYLILICWVIYSFSYWTVQVAKPDVEPWYVRLFNQMGRDAVSTGMAKAARSVGSMPESFYDAADLAGLLYANPLLEGRLLRYPKFLTLAERPEFQAIGQDTAFLDMRLKGANIRDVLSQPNIQAVVNNPDLLKQVWATLIPDLKDLDVFLKTGQSPKYDEIKILGRWKFNLNSAIAAFRRAKPNVPSTEMQRFKKWMDTAFGRTTFVATTEHEAILKNVPPLKAQAPGTTPSTEMQTLSGDWKEAGGKYQVTLKIDGQPTLMETSVEGNRLTIVTPVIPLVFDREG